MSQRQQLNHALGKLALQAIALNLARFRLHHHTVIELLEPELLELALQLGWLNQVGVSTTGTKIYAFYHSTFQEYFAARSIADRRYFFTGDIATNPAIFNPYWHETILFWFGRRDVAVSEKEAFIAALIDVDNECGKFYYYRAYFLAAAALAEFPESIHSQEIIDRLLQWRFAKFIPAQNNWKFYPLPIQDGARVALRKTDLAAAICGLEIFAQTVKNPFLCWQAAHSLGKVFDPGNAIAIQALVHSIELVTSGDLQIKICESLSRIDPNYNRIAIDTLVNIIQTGKTESLTRKAAFTLGKLSLQLPEIANNLIFDLTIKTLVQIVESGQDRANQIVALDNLRQIFPTHPSTHQTRPILIRDLSIFGQLVYLKVPRRQFYCPNCKKSPTEPLSWLNKKQRQTTRYQEYIYNRVKELTVKQVSENEKMSEDTVQDIFHKIARLKKKTGEHLNA